MTSQDTSETTTTTSSTPIRLQKKQEYTLDEVETFRDMLRFTNKDAMRAWVTEEGIWSWDEFNAAINSLLELPPTPTDKLLVLTEHANAFGGITVDGHIVNPDDLTRVDLWQPVYGIAPELWVDAKVISLREITIREHIILIKLIYTHMASLVGGEKA